MAKCKNCGFYKGGVGNVRRADVHNRMFFSDGPVSTQMADNVPQDDPTEAPKIGPKWANIAPRWANIGRRGAQHSLQRAQHRAKMGQHGPKMGQQQQL